MLCGAPGTRARSLMSGYGNVIVGKLNLKKKSKKKRAREEAEAAADAAEAEEDALVDASAAPDDAKPAAGDESGEWLTESEKRVRKQQRKNQARVLAQVATMTHRDKVRRLSGGGARASAPSVRARARAPHSRPRVNPRAAHRWKSSTRSWATSRSTTTFRASAQRATDRNRGGARHCTLKSTTGKRRYGAAFRRSLCASSPVTHYLSQVWTIKTRAIYSHGYRSGSRASGALWSTADSARHVEQGKGTRAYSEAGLVS